jgi:hypothetical protein
MIERLSHQCRAGTWNKNLKNSSYAIAAGNNKLKQLCRNLFASTSCRWKQQLISTTQVAKHNVKKERQEKNSHKNPEIVKKEVSTNDDAAA